MPHFNVSDAQQPSAETISITFWTVYIIEVMLPVFVITLAVIGRKSFQKVINYPGRILQYDTQLLRRPEARTPFARLCKIIFYRYRPLPFELVRIAVEITIFLYIIGTVELVVLLSFWCIFDLVQGLHVLNLVYLRHTRAARSSTSQLTYISLMYSVLYGFPLGFISKLMWIVWFGSHISLRTIFSPFYIEAVAALVFVFFFMIPNMCMLSNDNGCKSMLPRFQILILLLSFFAVWLLIYFNVSVCGSSKNAEGHIHTNFALLFNCFPFFRSRTTALLPLTVLIIISQFMLIWRAVNKGLVYRFLPEITFIWSSSLMFTLCVHAEDVGRTTLLTGTGAAALCISVVVTVIVNTILMADIMQGLKAPVVLHSLSSSRASEVEVKRRVEMRQSALKDYIHEGGKTMLKGTLLRYLKKRDRTKDCVVCLEAFKKTQEVQEDPDPDVNEDDGTATEDLLGIIRKCGHYFHFNCVWDWIQRNNTCPLCRIDVQITKETIKTVKYDDVRYALERKAETMSTVGSVSEIVNRMSENSAKTRPGVHEAMFDSDQVDVEIAIEQVEPGQEQINPAAPGNTYIIGDRSTSYKNHTRSLTKNCGICENVFQKNRRGMDIVVGYLRLCGHYFHYECIESYVKEHEKCPMCHSLAERHGSRSSRHSSIRSQDRAGNVIDETSENRERMSEIVGYPPPRGSRRHRADKKRQQKYSSRSRPPPNTDLISHHSTPNVRNQVSLESAYRDNSNIPGPSHQRNGYKRNHKSSNTAVLKRLVHSEDVLFAFLSDVQNDIKRSNGRKTPAYIV